MSEKPNPGPAEEVARLVSVMMPAHNAQAFIRSAIGSLLDQEYELWELLVVDDGSTDDTVAEVEQIGDPRIQILSQANQGEAVARNLALTLVRGQYLAFLDADDRFRSDHLAAAVSFLEANPALDAVYTDGVYIDDAGSEHGRLSEARRGPFEGDIFEQVVRASDVFGPPICVVARSRIIHTHELKFDPEIVIGPDWDFMVQLAQVARFGYIDQASCEYRIHDTNISHTVSDERRRQSLVKCRSRAIHRPRFAECSVSTRAYAFYDLLINLLAGHPEAQQGVTEWDAFHALPKVVKGRLLRRLAASSIGDPGARPFVDDWLRRAIVLNPLDARSAGLRILTAVSPALATTLIGWWAKVQGDRLRQASAKP